MRDYLRGGLALPFTFLFDLPFAEARYLHFFSIFQRLFYDFQQGFQCCDGILSIPVPSQMALIISIFVIYSLGMVELEEQHTRLPAPI